MTYKLKRVGVGDKLFSLVSPEVLAAAREAARLQGKSMNLYLEEALREKLEKGDRDND